MKPRHHVSRRAIELIKRFEGYRRTAAILPDGRWTIGYGHVKTAREGAEVSEDDAEALLIYDLMAVTRAVNDWTFTPLSDNQFDALVCFAFNVGLDSFRTSPVLRKVNEGELLQAAHALEMWRKADFEGDRIVVDALVRRRAAEKALFLTPAQGWIPAPSAVLQPRLDQDAPSSHPAQSPIHLTVPMDGPQAKAEPAGDPDLPAEEKPFPVTMAAENLAARLHALAPDGETHATIDEAADATQDSAHDSAVAVQDFEDLGTAEVLDQEVDRLTLEEPSAPQTSEAQGEAPGAAGKLAQDHVTFRSIDARPEARTAQGDQDLRRLVGLGATGLGCLGFAIAWSLFAAPGEGVWNSSVVSTIAGLAGIGCLATAVYLLLVRLGGSEE